MTLRQRYVILLRNCVKHTATHQGRVCPRRYAVVERARRDYLFTA
jgi:hypothetical protein